MALLTYFMVMLSKKRGNGLVKLNNSIKVYRQPNIDDSFVNLYNQTVTRSLNCSNI